MQTASHSRDSDTDSDNEHHAPSRSVSKGLPKKGTWEELSTCCPIGVSAKVAKGISETTRQLTERLCTRKQNVLQHDTQWTDLKKSEVRDNAWAMATSTATAVLSLVALYCDTQVGCNAGGCLRYARVSQSVPRYKDITVPHQAGLLQNQGRCS